MIRFIWLFQGDAASNLSFASSRPGGYNSLLMYRSFVRWVNHFHVLTVTSLVSSVPYKKLHRYIAFHFPQTAVVEYSDQIWREHGDYFREEQRSWLEVDDDSIHSVLRVAGSLGMVVRMYLLFRFTRKYVNDLWCLIGHILILISRFSLRWR